MPQTIRTFIAIALPASVTAALKTIQNGFRPYSLNVRWVPAENIHLTLAFLGNVHADDLNDVFEAGLAAASIHIPLTIAARGVGVFPAVRKARVLWVGVTGQTERLASLKHALDARLEAVPGLGYRKDSRAFRAHLTLGRAKGRIDPLQLQGALEAFADVGSESFTVDHIHVIKSSLKKQGAVYTNMMRIPLTTGPGI